MTEPHSVFNIGSQQGQISNVGRDMIVERPVTQLSFGAVEPQAEIERLRREIDAIDLAPSVRRAVSAALDEVAHEAAKPRPAKPKIARRLEQVAAVVREVETTIEPLARLARWLGPVGLSLAALL